MRNKIIIGLTSAVAAAAIAAPAQAQVAPPAPAAGAANGATVQIGSCTVKHSRHGYTWASCPIVANNVAYNQPFDIQFNARADGRRGPGGRRAAPTARPGRVGS